MATVEVDGKRLDRIEDKIDKLSEAMVSLARAEQRILSIEAERSSQNNRMDAFANKLDQLEGKIDVQNATTSIVSKLFYIVVMAFATGWAANWFGLT
jgi:phage shock protein A